MSNQKKIFFLCPTWDYHPDGPIKLGSIILSPSAPTEALNNFIFSTQSIPPNVFPRRSIWHATWPPSPNC
ncbi:hypothetical protein V8C34DRAFT_297866 [Trichoderma compactum]